MSAEFATARIYTDFSGLAELKAGARQKSPEARREAARQFEALFLQQVLKTMRQAGAALGTEESDGVALAQDLFDRQVALALAGRGGVGLARAIERQLGGEPQTHTDAIDRRPPPRTGLNLTARAQALAASEAQAVGPTREAPGEAETSGWPPESPEAFVAALMPAARRAARALGVDPKVLIAQAALESGWGRRLPADHQGPSFNLFGIKADGAWTGREVRVPTLEYRQGVAVREQAAFRAYGSPDESLADYVEFIRGNPRYQPALARADQPEAYLRALQEAGYATDPKYADKILAILDSPALRAVE